MITGRINNLIQNFKSSPELFENDVWNCYEKCKEEVIKMGSVGLIPLDSYVYGKYIDHIVDGLGI